MKLRGLALFLAFFFLSPGLFPQAIREYDLKAAFLYNFTQFVEWPTDAFQSPSSPIVIGVLGTDPFGRTLNELIADERVYNRPLTVRRFSTPGQVEQVHLLFMDRSLSRDKDVVERFKGKPILTVGDYERFPEMGGIIGFQRAQNKIKIRINITSAKQANLLISSKLLRIAEIIGD